MPIPRHRLAPVLVLIVAGCMKESAYQAPISVPINLEAYDEAAMIEYRDLAPSDFQAEKCPAGIDAKHTGAVTVAIVRTTMAKFHVQSVMEGDSTFCVATVDSFQFEARMSQNDSWWNSNHKHITTEQMLEHEQIHFALSELAARRANADLPRMCSRIRASAKEPVDAIALARQRFNREVAGVQSGVHARNAQFDLETMNGQRVERNHEWFDRIQRELEATDPDF